MTFPRVRSVRGARSRRAATVGTLVLAVATAVAGCGGNASPRAAGPATPGAIDPPTVVAAPGVRPTTTIQQASYTTSPPGPRRGAIVGADMLVFDQRTLAPAMVSGVRKLPGVADSTTISLAQTSIEDKVYNVAAVDPAQYRLFAPNSSAELQPEWDRVAGGEIAVSPELRRELPIDRDGYLTLTVAGTRQRVHVGAWAPQAGDIDMVVNQRLGQALGMVPDNAMIVATGSTSPESLRKPVAAIVGKDISVQNLDVVARLGLDPGAFQTAVVIGTLADAVGTYHYAPAGGGRITPDPAWVASHIVTETVPILGPVTCNKDFFPQLKAALGEVVHEGLASAIHPSQYGGCYNARFIAGTTTLSNHSFGLAIDLNVPENERGTVGQMDRGVVAIFKRWGFTWGGDWHYTDPMHFELNQLVRPG